MSRQPEIFMPVFIGDLKRHVSRLNREEKWSYFAILMDYWVNGPPPDDDAVLCLIAECSGDAWSIARKKLEPFFDIRDGHWFQRRSDLERDKAKARKAKAVKASGARWPQEADARSIPGALLEPMLERCPSPPQKSKGSIKDTLTLPREEPRAAQKRAAIPAQIMGGLMTVCGADFAAAYVAPAAWDPKRRELTPATRTAAQAIKRHPEALEALRGFKVSVVYP